MAAMVADKTKFEGMRINDHGELLHLLTYVWYILHNHKIGIINIIILIFQISLQLQT